MLPNQNDKPSTPRSEDLEWAKQVCSELIAGCTLNIKLVKSGLWPKLLCDMDTVGDLASYATFIQELGLSYRRAREVREARGY